MRVRTGTARRYTEANSDIGSFVVDHGIRGGTLQIKVVDADELPNTAGTTHTCTVALIPAGSLVLAVTARVADAGVLASSATWSLGISGNTDLFGTTKARTGGTTLTPADHEAESESVVPSHFFAAQTALVLTSSSGNWSTGALGHIRIQIHYITATAPTTA